MDPTEAIKVAAEIGKAAGTAAGLSIPFTAVVKRMLGPAADELAEMWRDQVRLYRYERQLKCVEKAEKMAKDAGFTPQAVPPKILFPLLEGASWEEDENLHDMWAALLANAASPEHAETVRPGFIAILKQMAPDEARLLKWIDGRSAGWSPHVGGLNWHVAEAELGFRRAAEARNSRHFDPRMLTCLDGLEAHQLIRREYLVPDKSVVLNESRDLREGFVPFRIILTERGSAFLYACQPPEPKPNF